MKQIKNILSNSILNDLSGAVANTENHDLRGGRIVDILKTFQAPASLVGVNVGPTVTRYDIFPDSGVRVSKIQRLEDDIALALGSSNARIIAPVPNERFIGIEVPNEERKTVGLRNILESKEWVESKYRIPIALGEDVSGNPLVVDLAKMPHLLIAGSTGSGKTVCINSIIASLLFKFSPEDLKMVMIDPKIVELSVYEGIPHLMEPVVTNPSEAPRVLNGLIDEMTRRYQLFADIGVRDITSYKSNLKNEPMPYIVCIVDELADLMMTAKKDVEKGIVRLSQLARAAGIHLIIATQRPSVDVITGVIKANLPARISFKTVSRVDSRTILDQCGAERLVGLGDMLYLPPDSSDLIRCQGTLVTDKEVSKIVEGVMPKKIQKKVEDNDIWDLIINAEPVAKEERIGQRLGRDNERRVEERKTLEYNQMIREIEESEKNWLTRVKNYLFV